MSALLTVVPMDSKPAKARCADCIRDTDGEMASPCKRHRRKYDGHGVAALSEEQVVAFLAAAQSDVRANAIFRLVFGHGLRISEASRLRLEDVNFKENTIRVCPLKKKKATSYLEPLLPGEKEALTAYLAVRPECGRRCASVRLTQARHHGAANAPLISPQAVCGNR